MPFRISRNRNVNIMLQKYKQFTSVKEINAFSYCFIMNKYEPSSFVIILQNIAVKRVAIFFHIQEISTLNLKLKTDYSLRLVVLFSPSKRILG